MLRLERLAALLLLAGPALAQPAHLDGVGGYALYGDATPERLLFPDGADPNLIVGARLSPHLDVQVGVGTRTDRQWNLGRDEVAVYDFQEQTKAVVAALGYTDRIGRARLRASFSVGSDRYTVNQAAYRPDSVDYYVRDPGQPPTLARGEALVFDTSAQTVGRFGHLGTSLSVGLPVSHGRVQATPTVGVGGSVSVEVRSALSAQAPRAMAFVRLPVTVRVRGVALTAEMMLGGATALGGDSGVFTVNRAPGELVAGSSLRLNL